MLPNKLRNKLLNLLLVWNDSDTSCRTCCSTGHMCGNKLRASAASSIFRRHEGGSLCCGISRLQPTNQKMEFLMTSYSVRCCYWADFLIGWTKMCQKCVAICCSTCVQCERFQQHSRTQVEQQVQQHVASVKALLSDRSCIRCARLLWTIHRQWCDSIWDFESFDNSMCKREKKIWIIWRRVIWDL